MALPLGYPLPAGWKEFCTVGGRRYFVRVRDSFSESTFIDPHGPFTNTAPLPPGWQQRTDSSHRWYFFHRATGIMTFEDPRFPRSRFLPAEQVQRGDTPSKLWRYGEILPPAVTAPTHSSESPNAEGSAEREPQTNEVPSKSEIQSYDDTDSARTLTGDVRNPDPEYLDSASDGWHTPRTKPEPTSSHTAPRIFSDSTGGHVASKAETESMDKSEPNDIELLLQSSPAREPSSKIESSKPQDASQPEVNSNVKTETNGDIGSLPSSPAHYPSPKLPPVGSQAILKSKKKRKNKNKSKLLPVNNLGAPNAKSKSPPNDNQGILHIEMKLPPISNLGALSSGDKLPPIGNQEPFLSNMKPLQSDMKLPPIDDQRTHQFGIKLPPIASQEALWSEMKSLQSEMKSLHFGMKSLESVITSFQAERKSDVKRLSDSHVDSVPSSADEVIMSRTPVAASSQRSSSPFNQSQSQPAPEILPDLIIEQHRPGLPDLAMGALDPASTKPPQADYVENSVTDRFEKSQRDQFKMIKSKAQQKKEKKARQYLEKAKKRATAPPLLSLAARDRIEKEKAARQLAEVLMKSPLAPLTKPPVKPPAKIIEALSETTIEDPPAKLAMKQSAGSSILQPTLEQPAKLTPTEYSPLKRSMEHAAPPSLKPPMEPPTSLGPKSTTVTRIRPIVKLPRKPAVELAIDPTVEPAVEASVEPAMASMSPVPDAEVTSYRAERNLEASGRPKRHRHSDPSPESPPFADSDFPTQNHPEQQSQDVMVDDRYWRLDVGDGDAPYHYLLSRTSQNPYPDGSRRIEHLEVAPIARLAS